MFSNPSTLIHFLETFYRLASPLRQEQGLTLLLPLAWGILLTE